MWDQESLQSNQVTKLIPVRVVQTVVLVNYPDFEQLQHVPDVEFQGCLSVEARYEDVPGTSAV